jgi:predicted GIY-YIG superfamily endonuclease
MPRNRGKQLVCQMLERFDSKALEEYKHIIRSYIHDRDGVYALYHNDNLYYVGLARNLNGRLKNHFKDHHRGLWNRFSVYLTIGNSFVKEMESLLLRIALPKGNKKRGKFVKCEDLRRKFVRDYKADANKKFRQLVGRPHIGKATDAKAAVGGRKKLGHYISKGMALKARHKRKDYRARARKNGVIKFQGRVFDSPSAAAKEASGGLSSNGWSFWHYERAPGDWVPLKYLRQGGR